MHKLLAIIFTGILCFASVANADAMIAIVTQRDSLIKSISIDTLKQLYLRKKLLDSNGNRWIPLNLPLNHELRRSFSLLLFNKLPEDQEDYWNELYFQGIYPPEVLASEEAVLRFIELTPGSIGYIQKSTVDKRVKILSLFTVPKQD
jgi:folate-dependent tRNA-U54 methylase TrmFO/GidA